ncbi:MAG: TRAP transporter substrate-binding protein DctP [Niabella sp.]
MRLTFVLLLTGFLFLSSNAQKILKYSDHESPNEMRTLFLQKVLFPNIEKESEGRIKIEAYWNGELSSSYDALKKVSKGDTVDITTVVPEYTGSELPTHQLFKSFLVGPTGQKQVSFFRKMFKVVPEFTQELHQHNVEPIFLSTGFGVGFFSREPIHSLPEIKNKRWRTASFWHRDYLINYGSIPVTIPWGSQVYKAFEEKTLDGLMVNVDGGYQLKVYEQTPYILASKKLWLGHLYIVAINKQTWESLEQRDKDAIKRAAEKSYRKLGGTMDKSFDEQMEKLKAAGAKYRILTDKELNDFEKAVQYPKVQSNWIKEQESNGVKNIAEILEKMKKELKK